MLKVPCLLVLLLISFSVLSADVLQFVPGCGYSIECNKKAIELSRYNILGDRNQSIEMKGAKKPKKVPLEMNYWRVAEKNDFELEISGVDEISAREKTTISSIDGYFSGDW